MKCSLGISNFLEEISSLFHSIVFLYFFALITEEGFLILLAILWNSAFRWVYLSLSPLPLASLLFSAICKAFSDNLFTFHISFSWEWSWFLPPVQWHKPPSIVLQALCLSNLIPCIYSSHPLYNCKGFDILIRYKNDTFASIFIRILLKILRKFCSLSLLYFLLDVFSKELWGNFLPY